MGEQGLHIGVKDSRPTPIKGCRRRHEIGNGRLSRAPAPIKRLQVAQARSNWVGWVFIKRSIFLLSSSACNKAAQYHLQSLSMW